MMSLRYELNLLAHSFRKDVNDPDRIGIYMEHLPFYYQKYFKKALTHKFYGVESLKELLDLIRDTIVVNPKNLVIEPQLPAELESQGLYVMLTEEARRDRQRRLDLGDKSAAMNVQQAAGNAAALYMASAGGAGAAKFPSGAGGAAGGIVRPLGLGGAVSMPGGMVAAGMRPMQPWQQMAQWQGKGGGMTPMGMMRPPAWQQGPGAWRPPTNYAPAWKGAR